jgi:hypothetical protein
MTGKILTAVPLLLIPNGGDILCERNEEQFTSTLATSPVAKLKNIMNYEGHRENNKSYG